MFLLPPKAKLSSAARKKSTGGGGGDPRTSLLLHMDGSNGSTTFTDSSIYGLTVPAYNGAQISTANSKFGGASGYFATSNWDYLTVADNEVLEPGSEDLTWEFWMNTTTTIEYSTIYARVPGTFSSSMWTLMTNRYGPFRGDLALYVADYSTSSELLLAEGYLSGWSLRDGAWHHVAVVRNGSSWKAYIDGIERASNTWAGTIASSSSLITIGREQASGRGYVGYLDEMRISKGVARYTAPFTPPTAPFTS